MTIILAEESLQSLHTRLVLLMHTTYRLNASDLDENFLQGLKTTFQGREIEILVYDVVDETDYLMQSTANRERLLAAKANIEARSNLIEVSLESFE